MGEVRILVRYFHVHGLDPNAATSHPFPRPRPHSYHFSSSPIPDPNAATSQPDSELESKSQTQNQSPLSSYFSDVKASLQKESSIKNCSQLSRKTLSFSKSTPQTPPSKITSLEEICKNLSEFRRRSAVQPQSSSAALPPSHSRKPISFQELYKRNVLSKTEEFGSTSLDSTAKPVGAAANGGVLPFKAIHHSLSQLWSTAPE
ncbi:Mitochondrial/choloroplast ribosomal protein S15 [Abeliophyllum distichum]|uniref:Mitochondrial/choloroplast ribosomal protein S15 n=1 Tax=Abeliophyllum distichum TaxID=126358 RepID=A0ABD1QW49_9LAMI